MSAITELGAVLSRVGEDLPTEEVRLAADRMQAATGLLGYVLHTTSRSIGLTQLAAATTHLEQAFAALTRTREALGDYQRAIGLGVRGPVPPPAGAAERQPEVKPRPSTQVRQAPALDDWWRSRLDAITLLEDPPSEQDKNSTVPSNAQPAAGGHPRKDEKPPPTAELLRRIATFVHKEEPRPLRAELAQAGPAVGLRLTALCAPPLEELSTEILGRRLQPDDVPELRARLDKLTAKMLPGLPPHIPDILLGRVCRAEPKHGAHGAPEHPVDAAVGSAVLVGALLVAVRRTPESLALPEDEEK